MKQVALNLSLQLRDLYLDKHLPHYTWGKNDIEDKDIDELLREYVVNIDDKKMLLIHILNHVIYLYNSPCKS